MIGPVLVKLIIDGETEEGLYYLHRGSNSNGVAHVDYVESLAHDNLERERIVRDACYASYEELVDHINLTNEKARLEAAGPSKIYKPYMVELSMHKTEQAVEELTVL